MGINPKELRECIIRLPLQSVNLWSVNAEELLLATCAQETHGGEYVVQESNAGIDYQGGLGIYQMEGMTHDSLWRNKIDNRPILKAKIMEVFDFVEQPNKNELITNLGYATVMTRVFYMGVPEPIPASGDIDAIAAYWKKYYNTIFGQGTVQEFIDNYHRYLGVA